MAIFYIRSEFLPEICWEEVAEEIFFYIVLMSDLGFEPWLLKIALSAAELMLFGHLGAAI